MEINVFKLIILIVIIAYFIYIIVYEKRSIRSKLIEESVKLSKYKTIVSNEQVYEKHLEKLKLKEEEEYKLPKFKFKNIIQEFNYGEMKYYSINKNNNSKKIFYLHGGSYIENPLIFHYKFLDELATNSNLEIIIPIYPKAPKYNYEIAYEKVFGLYNCLFNKNDNVILMGDSAGGGFALGLSMMLKEKNSIKPSNIILMSPWLDITMKNKNIKRYEKKDPFLSKNALIKAGLLWADNKDRNNYLLSPINGIFNGIGNITIFIGTHEIFLPDARKLKYLLEKNNIHFNYYEYKKMNHVFTMFPIPEANDAKNKIISILSK